MTTKTSTKGECKAKDSTNPYGLTGTPKQIAWATAIMTKPWANVREEVERINQLIPACEELIRKVKSGEATNPSDSTDDEFIAKFEEYLVLLRAAQKEPYPREAKWWIEQHKFSRANGGVFRFVNTVPDFLDVILSLSKPKQPQPQPKRISTVG